MIFKCEKLERKWHVLHAYLKLKDKNLVVFLRAQFWVSSDAVWLVERDDDVNMKLTSRWICEIIRVRQKYKREFNLSTVFVIALAFNESRDRHSRALSLTVTKLIFRVINFLSLARWASTH